MKRPLFYDNKSKKEDNFQNLPQEIQDLFHEAIEEILSHNRDIENIEFERRDGFIPASYNRGGIVKIGFTDIQWFCGTGYSTGSKKFNDKIEKYIEQAYTDALEQFKEDKKEELKNIPEDKINYHDLYELDKGGLAEELSEYESEYMSGDYGSVMIDCRIMYHGDNEATIDVGLHASDAPYFRNKHVDSALEIDLKWNSLESLKKQLQDAVEKLKDFANSDCLELY